MNVTSIVVTHDMKSAGEIADRMAFLYEGSFLAIGTPDELYQSPDPRVQQFIHGWEFPEMPQKEGEME